MYELLYRIRPYGFDPLKVRLEEHIEAFGRDAIAAEVDAAADKPAVFVAVLLRVYRRFSSLVETAFNNDVDFKAALDKAFRSFVNKNAVTARAKGSAAVAKAP